MRSESERKSAAQRHCSRWRIARPALHRERPPECALRLLALPRSRQGRDYALVEAELAKGNQVEISMLIDGEVYALRRGDTIREQDGTIKSASQS